MVQIPINSTDNDRLKTRKVQQMLDDLGVLPADHSLRPTFLRSRRTASVLIDRALDGLAVDPSARKHCCKNSDEFTATINSKFATAYLVDDGGAGLPAGAIAYADFKNGTYYYGGNALSDFLVENEDWGTFTPADIVPGVGYQVPDASSGGQESPVLASALTTALINAGGFSLVADMIFVADPVHINSPEVQAIVLDFPGFAQQLTITLGSVSDSSVGHTPINNVTPGALHRAAMTLASDHLSMSVDGGAVDTEAVAEPFVSNFIAFNIYAGTLERFVFYPIKTDAELPALSAL